MGPGEKVSWKQDVVILEGTRLIVAEVSVGTEKKTKIREGCWGWGVEMRKEMKGEV